MTAITGLTQLSLLEKDIPPKIKENLEKISTSAKYLLNLIDEVLETSKINAGKVVSISSALPENQIFDDVNAIIMQKAKNASLHYEAKFYGCEGKYAMVDSEHLTRILINLLGNAIKFTPADGHVKFEAYAKYKGDKIYHTYKVIDDGCGIDPSFQKRMYLPFEQENEIKGLREGTGLGLFIVRSLVDLLGGSISCVSERGKGSTFSVSFTFDQATKEQIQRADENNDAHFSSNLRGKNVLVVEDSQINAEVIVNLLKAKGIASETASNGKEAIEMYKSHGPYHYNAILMDIMMPVMDGFEATKKIRSCELADSTTIPIVALTADTFAATEEKCLEAGMNGHLPKPIDTNALYSILSREFERSDKQTNI